MPLFVTANLGRHVDTAEFLRNVRALDDEAGRGTIIGFQEIDEADTPDEHHGLRKVLGDDFDFAGWSTREPIAFGDRWTKRREEIVKAAKGLVRLTPARSITECVLEHDGGQRIVFLNLHYPRNDSRLLSRWNDVRSKHKGRLSYWVARGYTVVWTSDVNRVTFAPLHRDERTLVRKGLDRICCVEAPGGVQLEVVDTGAIDLTIDGHDAQWARVALHPAKEPA